MSGENSSIENVAKYVLPKARVIDYGTLSSQVTSITEELSQGRVLNLDRFGQVSANTKTFLTNIPTGLPERELASITVSLLAAPSPQQQDSILNNVEFVIHGEPEAVDKEDMDLFVSVLTDATFYHALGIWSFKTHVLDFLKNPANQKGREEGLKEAFGWFEDRGNYGILLPWLSEPANQVGRENLIKEAIDHSFKLGYPEHVFDFLKIPVNQAGREDLLEKCFKEVEKKGSMDGVLSFLQVPQNQIGREVLLNQALEAALLPDDKGKIQWESFLEFAQEPANQLGREDVLNRALSEASPEEQLIFFKNPENQKKFPEKFDDALRVTIASYLDKSSGDSLQTLLYFFGEPKNQPTLTHLDSARDKIDKSIRKISDETLRGVYYSVFMKYLQEGDNPLSPLLLDSPEDLALETAGDLIGVDPMVLKSWDLSDEEKDTLLPIFARLAKFKTGEQKLLFDLILPFKPREEVKAVKDFNQKLTDWFSTMDFILGLNDTDSSINVMSQLMRLKAIQQASGIDATSLDIPRRLLRWAVKDQTDMENEALERFTELVGLERDQFTFAEFKKFAESWNMELKALTTLALHYKTIYKEGLPLLGKIVGSLMTNEYHQMRYNLSDDLTAEQLAPLLKGRSKDDQARLLQVWQAQYPHFSIKEDVGTTVQKQIDPGELREELVHRATEQGDFHAEEILKLPEFKSLNAVEQEQVLNGILFYLRDGQGSLNVGEIGQLLGNTLGKEKASVMMGLGQFFKDLLTSNKSRKELATSLSRLLKAAQEKWPELYDTELISLDLGQLVLPQLNEDYEDKIPAVQRTYLSFITDHPKTLLEIGKYPEPSSCQNYESRGSHNTGLLGYVFDSHIKATCLVEVDAKGKLTEQDLNNSKVELDEGHRIATLTLINGEKVSFPFSRPIARRIVMLGQKNGEPMLVEEPIYSKHIDYDMALSELEVPIQGLVQGFMDEGVNVDKTEESSKEITIAGSHNPVGHYNDLARGLRGENQTSYNLIHATS